MSLERMEEWTEPQQKRLLRGLVLAEVGISGLAAFLPVGPLLNKDNKTFWWEHSEQIREPIGSYVDVYTWLYWPVGIVWIASVIGLLALRKWGRSLYVLLVPVSFAFTVLEGVSYFGGLQAALANCSLVISGFILALAYTRPIRDLLK